MKCRYGKCVSLMLSQQKYGCNVCTVSTNISLTTKNNQLWSTLMIISPIHRLVSL